MNYADVDRRLPSSRRSSSPINETVKPRKRKPTSDSDGKGKPSKTKRLVGIPSHAQLSSSDDESDANDDVDALVMASELSYSKPKVDDFIDLNDDMHSDHMANNILGVQADQQNSHDSESVDEQMVHSADAAPTFGAHGDAVASSKLRPESAEADTFDAVAAGEYPVHSITSMPTILPSVDVSYYIVSCCLKVLFFLAGIIQNGWH
jgi:hypothetical protein